MMDAIDSDRMSAEELDRARGRELRKWKEERVDEAVALIRVGTAAHRAPAYPTFPLSDALARVV